MESHMHVILVMLILCGSLLGITYMCRYFIFRKWLCLERKDDAWAFTGQWLVTDEPFASPPRPISRVPLTMLSRDLLPDIILNVSVWMAISVSFSVYNKFFYSLYGGSGFPFPCLTTAIHELIKLSFSRMWAHHTKTEIEELPFRTNLLVVAPIGLASALDIALSNYSFETISVSAYTVIKSSNVIFMFLFGLALGLEKLDLGVFLSVLGIVCGFLVAMYGFSDSEPWGLAACMSATVISAVRWTLVHYLVAHDPHSRSSKVVLYRIAPAAFCSMVPLFLYNELGDLTTYLSTDSSHQLVELSILICMGGCLGIILLLLEINILSLTSSLTFSVVGAGKELLQVALAIAILQDGVTMGKILGIGLSIVSVIAYNVVKAKQRICSKDELTAGPPGSPQGRYMRVAANELADAFDADMVGLEMAEQSENFFD